MDILSSPGSPAHPLSPIRLAFVGVWHLHAKDHLASAQAHPDAEIAGAWDDHTDALAEFTQRHQLATFLSFEAILNDPTVHAVVVNGPTTSHDQVIAAALRAGKAVFTEKALSTSGTGAAWLRDLAREQGLSLGVALPRIYRGYTETFRETLSRELLGEVLSARIRISHDGSTPTPEQPRGWLPETFFRKSETGGGVLIDLGAHALYLALYLFGDPQDLTAQLQSPNRRGVEEHAEVALQYGSQGPTVVAESSFLGPREFVIEIRGTQGYLRFRETPQEHGWSTDLPCRWSKVRLQEWEQEPFDIWLEQLTTGTVVPGQTDLACRLAYWTEQAYLAAGW